MTFASLKKKSPSASPEQVSVDDFIDEANLYAMGLSKVVPLHPADHQQDVAEPFKSHCFTLSIQAREKLDQLCEATGISRSRLLRIMLNELHPELDKARYLASQIR
ncbi:hypothetical protein GCM10009092_30170 [Bowmanella denitrificans]|uniref:Ribbon-helix-helix protein CopG domain-containing protein n=1 Tax=Bowmanella denitrificans TaxID=366582 RepID=A0ABP3HBN0_9ALTE|nr:ribbon-helix-helix protein, CopG family [Bowmanella denitrificans]